MCEHRLFLFVLIRKGSSAIAEACFSFLFTLFLFLMEFTCSSFVLGCLGKKTKTTASVVTEDPFLIRTNKKDVQEFKPKRNITLTLSRERFAISYPSIYTIKHSVPCYSIPQRFFEYERNS